MTAGMTDGARWRGWLSPSARAGYAYGVTLVALPPLAIYSFESLAALIAVAGLLALNAESAARVRGWLLAPGPTRWLALFSLWLIVCASWAEAPWASAQKAVGLAALWGCGLLLIASSAQLSAAQRRRCGWLFVGAILTMALVFGLERVSDGAFAKLVKHIEPSAEVPEAAVTHVALVKIQRGVTALVCLMWTAGAAVTALARSRWAGAALIGVAAGAIAIMPNSTSVLALVLASAVFLAALLAPRVIGLAVTAVLVLETLAFPWIILWLPRGDVDSAAATLKFSAIHRLEIYRYVSGLVADRPLFGYGFDSARVLSKSAPKVTLPGFDHPVPLISLHPHNGPLQVWLETGAVGALVLAFFVATLGRFLLESDAARPVRAALWATLTAVGTIASLSFGVWQYHWLSVIIIAAAANAVIAALSMSAKNGMS